MLQEAIDIVTGITNEQCIKMAENLQFKGEQRTEAAKQIKRLYQLFCRVDATQVEINPFAETPDGRGRNDFLSARHKLCSVQKGGGI